MTRTLCQARLYSRAIITSFILCCLSAALLYGGEEGMRDASRESLVHPKDAISDFTTRMALARLKKRQGELKASLNLYRQLVETHPDNYGLRAEFAEVLLDANLDQEARKQAQHILRANPENIYALEVIARIHIHRDEPDKAKDAIQRISVASDYERTKRLKTLAKLYGEMGSTKEGAQVLQQLLDEKTGDPLELIEEADAFHRIGHAQECAQLYQQVLVDNNSRDTRLQFANRMLMWGAFNRAIRIYREHLNDHPDDTDVKESLIAVLASSQRYAEAKELCHNILRDRPERTSTRRLLCRIYTDQKRFRDALRYATLLLKENENSAVNWHWKGRALKGLQQHKRAILAFKRASEHPGRAVDSLIQIGRLLQDLGQPKRARRYFQQALDLRPTSVQAQFYVTPKTRRNSDSFIKSLRAREGMNAPRMTQWARLFNASAMRSQAIQCYKYALNFDEDYFPARLELAETYGYDHQYATALDMLNQLQAEFPESRKILLDRARVSAWGKRYKRALKLYSELHNEAPGDPVPLREKARAALWGKRYETSMKAYDQAQTPSLNRMLKKDVIDKVPQQPSENYQELLNLAEEAQNGDRPYGLYADLQSLLLNDEIALSTEQKNTIRDILLYRSARYEIQKFFWLEQRAKQSSWNRKRLRAAEAYKNLIELEPGNMEARFNLGQVQCALGLLPEERRTYEEILRLDPYHNLANKALERLEIRSSPSLHIQHNYWHELGRGELTDIRRQRSALGIEIPVTGHHRLRLTGVRLREYPGGGDDFTAFGHRIEWNGILTPALRASVAWEHADFDDGEADDTNTGHAQLSYNLRDYVTLDLGYRRQNEFFNVFGIRDGTQSNRWWLSATSHLTHRIEAGYRAEYIDYSDDNTGQHQSAWLEYILLDHPRQLSVEGRLGYRDTDKESEFIFNGGQLSDIVHPYWTPRDYVEGTLTLKWRHDLSKLMFCGGQQHYYQIELATGDNSDKNTSAELRATWHYGFNDHWTINASGLIHRSEDWDADGLWFSASYHF